MRNLSALLLIALLPALATANVIVKREKPTVERKIFDPAHPPPDMPHLNAGEAAITVSGFRCRALATYELLNRKPSDAQNSATIFVKSVTWTLRLDVVIWTPEGCSEKLKAHEEGHRKLSEEIYGDRAVQAARTAAAAIDGHRLTGEGDNLNAAISNTINAALNDTGKNYLKMTADITDEIGNIYDEITAHGLNPIAEDDAIHQAFRRYEHDHPTTRPAKPGKG